MKAPKILSVFTLSSTICLGAFAAADNTGASAPSIFNPDQVSQVKTIIHDYLVTNPQVLVEASESLQKQEMQQAEQKAQSAIAQNAPALFAEAASPVAGNPKGDVTVVEFFDYQCPHCKDASPMLEKLRGTDPNLRIVYKELPIFGSSSREASAAALAAQLQGPGNYLKLHAALMKAPNPLNKEKILQIAQSVGLDTTKLAKDMNSDAVKKQIEDNFKLAQALGLMGTPTFIVAKWTVDGTNNTAQGVGFAPGVVDANKLKLMIDQARKS